MLDAIEATKPWHLGQSYTIPLPSASIMAKPASLPCVRASRMADAKMVSGTLSEYLFRHTMPGGLALASIIRKGGEVDHRFLCLPFFSRSAYSSTVRSISHSCGSMGSGPEPKVWAAERNMVFFREYLVTALLPSR